MPLPDFVIALAFVLGVKFGSSAGHFMRYATPSKDEMDAMPPERAEYHNVSTHGGGRVEQAKSLPIVDNADVTSRYD